MLKQILCFVPEAEQVHVVFPGCEASEFVIGRVNKLLVCFLEFGKCGPYEYFNIPAGLTNIL